MSHARRIIENAFGILVQRWRVFDSRMYLSDTNAIKIIKAATVLHNFLTQKNADADQLLARLNPAGREYNNATGALHDIRNRQGLRSPTDAMEVRDWYKTYFFSPIGAVPWQLD